MSGISALLGGVAGGLREKRGKSVDFGQRISGLVVELYSDSIRRNWRRRSVAKHEKFHFRHETLPVEG